MENSSNKSSLLYPMSKINALNRSFCQIYLVFLWAIFKFSNTKNRYFKKCHVTSEALFGENGLKRIFVPNFKSLGGLEDLFPTHPF